LFGHAYAFKTYEYICKLANSLTNQLAVSQVADWSPCGLVDSPKCLVQIWSI